MFDFHEKRKLRGYVYSPFTVLLLVGLSVLLSFSVYERFVVEREMAAREAETAVRLEELRLRAAILESKVEHLSDERGIEEELRRRFDAAKEGEQVVIIVEDETRPSVKSEELTEPEDEDEKSDRRGLLWW